VTACPWCDEAILDDEDTRAIPHVAADGTTSVRPWHRECLRRSIVGSYGHLLELCPCFDGDLEDPPGLTRRQAARLACRLADLLADSNARLGSPRSH